MSVLKKKWIDICNNHNLQDNMWSTNLQQLLDEIDQLIDEMIQPDVSSGSTVQLYSAYEDMWDKYLTSQEYNDWKDMPIFVSSFRFNDSRIVNEINARMFQYAGFYKKVITDEGVARKLVTHRTFAGNGTSTGNYKNYESDTPQINLTNFDEGLEYATRLEKNDDTITTNKAGVTDYELKSFNWDEALKNLKMLYYNDLIRYINSIPVLLYNYYALDQYPVCQTVEEYFDYIKTVRGWYAR